MASLDVVIPCYNYADLLPQCVASVLAQDIVEDLRIIIIDNASTDDSVEIARALAESDRRIKIVCHEKNLGPHASFNEGIDLARADYFMILCADDLAAANSISCGIRLMERFPQLVLVLGAYVEWFPGGRQPESQQSDGYRISDGVSFIERCCDSIESVPAHAILVRTRTQRRVGHYRASLPFMDDLEMALRLAVTGSVAELDGPLAIRRIHLSSSVSESLWQDRLRFLKEREAVFRSFFENEGADVPGAGRLHGVVRRRLAEAAYWSVASHLFRGRRDEAKELFTYGCGLDRASMLFPPVGYLFRKHGALKRIAAVVSSAFQ